MAGSSRKRAGFVSWAVQALAPVLILGLVRTSLGQVVKSRWYDAPTSKKKKPPRESPGKGSGGPRKEERGKPAAEAGRGSGKKPEATKAKRKDEKKEKEKARGEEKGKEEGKGKQPAKDPRVPAREDSGRPKPEEGRSASKAKKEEKTKGAVPPSHGPRAVPSGRKPPETRRSKLLPWAEGEKKYGTHLPWKARKTPEATRPDARSGEARKDVAAKGDKGGPTRSEKAPKEKLRVHEIKVIGNKKTDGNVILTIARVRRGVVITDDLIEKIRRRLISSKLFKQVKVFWEVCPKRKGWAILYIEAKDRHSWFISPMFTWQQGRWGGAIAYGEYNLFGWRKRLGVAATYLTDSQALGVGYQDPSIRGTPFTWQAGLGFERKLIKEYLRVMGAALHDADPVRETWVQQLFASLQIGYRWLGRLSTNLGYKFGLVSFDRSRCYFQDPPDELTAHSCAPAWGRFDGLNTGPIAFRQKDGMYRAPAYTGGKFWRWWREGVLQLGAGYSNMVDIYGVREGYSVSFKLDVSHPNLGSEFNYVKWSLRASKSFRFFKEHSLVISGKHEQSYHTPFHRDPNVGGSLLQGYVSRQAVGDTNTTAGVSYTVPLFKLWWFHFRQVFYYKFAWIFFRKGGKDEPYYEDHDGMRRYYLAHTPGPRDRASFLQGIGTGLRLYVKAVVIPLLGVDVAYGFESNAVRFYFYLGKEY